MASFLDKIKVKTAVEDRTKLDLGSDHITTGSWFQYNVAYNKELVPRETIDVRMESLTRMLPLVRPTFGRANMNNRAFFVPYRVIWEGWNDFITDAPHVPYNTGSITGNVAINTSVPTISNAALITLFRTSGFGVQDPAGSNTDNDFVIGLPSGSTSQVTGVTGTEYWDFTNRGRQAYKILLSLGYNVCWDASDTTVYSALPLLAIAKVYVDWYWPSAYQDMGPLAIIKALFKISNVNTNVSISGGDLATLFTYMNYVCYDSDYFTAAWENPTGPNLGNYTAIQIRSIDNGNDASQAIGVGTSATTGPQRAGGSTTIARFNAGGIAPASTLVGNISQYVIDSLKKLTDYMKRHQLVGAKAVDRYLARFGVQLHETQDRSFYLGSHKVPIQIGDVTSQGFGTGSGEVLGAYAGKGMGYGDGHWNYETNEYGQFIIISTIIPAAGYYQGIDRNVMHTSKLDFWTPEFDSLGAQAISKSELYLSRIGTDVLGQSGMQTGVFGFTPRYAEYKVGHDRLTGDFRINNANTGEDAWTLMRNIDGRFNTQASVVVSEDFLFGERDWAQFNRIFQGGKTNATQLVDDTFTIIHHFEIASYAPMKPMFENYEFDSEGKEVTEDAGGVAVN